MAVATAARFSDCITVCLFSPVRCLMELTSSCTTFSSPPRPGLNLVYVCVPRRKAAYSWVFFLHCFFRLASRFPHRHTEYYLLSHHRMMIGGRRTDQTHTEMRSSRFPSSFLTEVTEFISFHIIHTLFLIRDYTLFFLRSMLLPFFPPLPPSSSCHPSLNASEFCLTRDLRSPPPSSS